MKEREAAVNVMIVDDEYSSCVGMVRRVERMRLPEIDQICCETSAAAVIAKLKQAGGQWIVVTDIVMPEINGLEMIKRLRTEGVAAHFIVFSAHELFGYAKEAVRLGAVDYLLKPCSYSELLETFHRILANPVAARPAEDEAAECLSLIAEDANTPKMLEKLSELLPRCGMDAHPLYAVVQFHPKASEENFSGCARLWFHHRNMMLLNCPDAQSLGGANPAPRDGWAGVSRFYTTIAALPDMIEQAGTALRSRLLYKRGSLIEYETEQKKTAEYKLSHAQLKELNKMLRAFDIEEIRAFLAGLLQPQNLAGLNYQAIEQLYHSLCGIFHSSKIELGLHCHQVAQQPDTFDDIGEMMNSLMEILDDLKTDVDSLKGQGAVEWAKDYAQKHLGEEINMAAIANTLNINYFYFSRLFSESTGQSFSSYVYELRMQEAARLLQRGQRVTDVAEAIGYTQTKNFSRAFHKRFGIPPSTWANNGKWQ